MLFELFALSDDLFLSLSRSDFFSDDPLPPDPLPPDQKSLGVIYIALFDFLLHENEILMEPEENSFAHSSIL